MQHDAFELELRWCRSISAFQSLASPSIRPRRCIQNVGQYHRCCCTNCLNDTQNKFIFRRGRPREHTTCTIAARFCCTLDTTGPVDIRRLLNPSIRYIALPFVASSIHIIARFSCCKFSRCIKKVCVCVGGTSQRPKYRCSIYFCRRFRSGT